MVVLILVVVVTIRNAYASKVARVPQGLFQFGGILLECFLHKTAPKSNKSLVEYAELATNSDFPHWQCKPFDLDNLRDNGLKAVLCLLKIDVHLHLLQISDELVNHNRITIDRIKALCVLLKRFAYLLPTPSICKICTIVCHDNKRIGGTF